MAFIDHVAAQNLRSLREERGLSPEALATEIRLAAKTAPWGMRGCVDAHTLRRIERRGHVPGPRIQFVLSHFFGVDRREIWNPTNARLEVAA
jgi:transcriptional regulator with XRE-family HTH domain